MHKITEKEFTLDDFSVENLAGPSKNLMDNTIKMLNHWREIYIHADEIDSGYLTVKEAYSMSKKEIWWQLIQLLPSSYNQTRNVMMNYEVLANIYISRKNHKLDEWRIFCSDFIHSLPYASEIIESC